VNFYRKGFSLIEVLIVIAVLAVIATVVLPQFSKVRENQVLKSGVEDILSSLDKARANTLSSLHSSSYGVHFEAGQIVIFKGTSYSSGDSNNETVSIVSPASITSGNFDVYFNRLTGAPSNTGAITITTPNYSKTITISATGVASSN